MNDQQIHMNQNMSQHVPGTYVAHRNTMQSGSHNINHTNRTAPITVRWLIENYETADGVSLPRSTLYNHYLHHCQDGDMEPMNPASFGKLIRSVFLGLRTRRLGTRGNSKYHYYGLRIKQDSPLNQFTEENVVSLRSSGMRSHGGTAVMSNTQQQQYLGEVSVVLPNIETEDFSNHHCQDLSEDHLNTFETIYKEHCEAILDAITNLQFNMVETLWASFWKPSESINESITNLLDLPTMKKLCEQPVVQKFVLQCDFAFYQSLVQVLMPNVLRLIPGALTQSIRNFAKGLEGILKNIIEGYDIVLIQNKVSAVVAFSQTLRRYTSLNHLAQAARAVIQNHTQINQMLSDLNKLDFANIQEQAVWICQCDDETVFGIENQMKLLLRQHRNLEQWANWLSGIVGAALQPYTESTCLKRFARKFLKKWSFYSSLVIRDLTLRSAASFGSFHLIRLLFDEYIYYLVEHHVALVTNEHVISLTMANNEDNRIDTVKVNLPPLINQSVKIESSMIVPNQSIATSQINVIQNDSMISINKEYKVSEDVKHNAIIDNVNNSNIQKTPIKIVKLNNTNGDSPYVLSGGRSKIASAFAKPNSQHLTEVNVPSGNHTNGQSAINGISLEDENGVSVAKQMRSDESNEPAKASENSGI
ncbi:DNA-binding protein RFX2 [Intoshia linei]|uniref:DNA-binding protein RFX2 n=1 Tax=Intoshia linei TaxID=1819745 RepID=A0A177AVJ7_9BILA|nr:DNA-binding protein RFX2 [Intoshia linei]